MNQIYLVNIADRPNFAQEDGEGNWIAPGGQKVPAAVLKNVHGISRYLGRGDGEDQSGPWVFFNEFSKGTIIDFHKHGSNRIEFLIEGKIAWREPGKEEKIYGPGTMSYVEANTVYGYKVLEDAKILLVFDDRPGYGIS
jgi:hypothetical protein